MNYIKKFDSFLSETNNDEETVEEFDSLTQLSRFERANKSKLKISDMDYDEITKKWVVTFSKK
jgi:hypothetical protein